MKKKLKLDDIDMVVMSGPLSLEEEQLINDFIQRDKEKCKKTQIRKRAIA